MDLSNLRQSLHRLAILKDVIGQKNEDAEAALLAEDGIKNKKKEEGKLNLKDGIEELPNAPTFPSVPARLSRETGGGIRVYDNYEDDEWDDSSLESLKWERYGSRKRATANRPSMMRLKVLMNGVSAILCVSMGSNINLLKPEIAKRARLSVAKMARPAWVSLNTGLCKGSHEGTLVEYKVASAPYQIQDFFAQDEFYIASDFATCYVDGIVGIEWLEKYKPTVNYRLNRMELIDIRGRVHLIQSVPPSERAARGETVAQWINARADWNNPKSVALIK